MTNKVLKKKFLSLILVTAHFFSVKNVALMFLMC
jgi:hypothetical protein